MANYNHLLSVPCYNGTMLKQYYYNEFFELGQQKINFSFFELCLPDDDPVYTLKKVMEELELLTVLWSYVKETLCLSGLPKDRNQKERHSMNLRIKN